MEIPAGAKALPVAERRGLPPKAAFKTVERLYRETLEEGSCVCFERGGMWRAKLYASPGVTYTVYGEGPKPELRGSAYDGAVDGL